MKCLWKAPIVACLTPFVPPPHNINFSSCMPAGEGSDDEGEFEDGSDDEGEEGTDDDESDEEIEFERKARALDAKRQRQAAAAAAEAAEMGDLGTNIDEVSCPSC